MFCYLKFCGNYLKICGNTTAIFAVSYLKICGNAFYTLLENIE